MKLRGPRVYNIHLNKGISKNRGLEQTTEQTVPGKRGKNIQRNFFPPLNGGKPFNFVSTPTPGIRRLLVSSRLCLLRSSLSSGRNREHRQPGATRKKVNEDGGEGRDSRFDAFHRAARYAGRISSMINGIYNAIRRRFVSRFHSSSYFHLVTFLLEESSSIIFESIIYLFIYLFWIVESISQMWYKCIIRCIFNL